MTQQVHAQSSGLGEINNAQDYPPPIAEGVKSRYLEVSSETEFVLGTVTLDRL